MLALLATACVDGRTTGGDRDGGRDMPGDPIAPPGGVGLSIASVAWDSFGGLRVESLVANAADAAPAPLTRTAFSLETDAGAIVAAAEGCADGISVAPGRSLGCTLHFEPPPSQVPIRLHYRPDERSATAEIETCSASTPNGLCEEGLICGDGACVRACSDGEPDGVCAGADMRCVAGECMLPCSAGEPDGWCEEGACYQGACDAACHVLSPTAGTACTDCIVGVYETGVCGAEPTACNDPNACVECLLGGTSTCECADSFACGGCEDAIRAFASCFARECPACLG